MPPLAPMLGMVECGSASRWVVADSRGEDQQHQIPAMAEVVLDVVAEDEQKIDVAHQVQPAAVQKEGCQPRDATRAPRVCGNQSRPGHDVFETREGPKADQDD